MMLFNCRTHYASKFGKQQWPQDWKRSVFKRVTESDTTEQLATRSGQWEARADFWFGRNFIAGV